MSIAQRQDLLRLPTTLEAQLLGFRRRVWAIKMAEAVFLAVGTQEPQGRGLLPAPPLGDRQTSREEVQVQERG